MVHPTSRNKFLAFALSLLLWTVLAWIDLALGLKVRFGPFYAIPVLLIAWYFGRGWGIVFAFVSAAIWSGAQVVVLRDFAFTFYGYWDLFSGLLAFSAVALGTAWSKSLLVRQEAINGNLQQALERVRTLEGMLPICAWCHKVRNEQGAWEPIEDYVSEHSNTTWTHGICKDCAEKFQGHGFA